MKWKGRRKASKKQSRRFSGIYQINWGHMLHFSHNLTYDDTLHLIARVIFTTILLFYPFFLFQWTASRSSCALPFFLSLSLSTSLTILRLNGIEWDEWMWKWYTWFFSRDTILCYDIFIYIIHNILYTSALSDVVKLLLLSSYM